MATEQPGPARAARIVFLAFLAGPLLFTGVALALLPAHQVSSDPILLYIPFALAAVLFTGALVIRTRIPPAPPGAAGDEWWRINLSRVTILWAMLEGPSLFGAAMYLTLGNLLPLMVTAVGVVLLLLHAPDRIAEG
jgi:hypothetical protein